MIGSKILYKHYPKYGDNQYTGEEREGFVVDAFTDVSGRTKGDVFLGFGDVKGNIESKRMYKVEYKESWSERPYYENIREWQLIRIIEFKSALNQEVEKII